MNIKTVAKIFNDTIIELSENKSEFCHCPHKDFTRKRKLNFENVIRSILAMNGKTLTNELFNIYGYSPTTPSASAFVQQRSKLSENAMPMLFKKLNNSFDKDLRYEGYRLISVDGCHIHVPNNPDDPESYVKVTEKEHFHNEFHLNACWDIIQGTFIDAIVQKYRTQNEDKALIEMVERTSFDKAIFVCDRGYEAYNNLAHIQESGHKYVIRIKEKGGRGIIDGFDIDNENEYDMYFELAITRKGSKEIREFAKECRNKCRCIPLNVKFDYLEPPNYKDPAEFYILKFRILRVRISDTVYENLVTNLDSNTFPASKIKEIYGMRWGIETSFRHLKYAVGLLKFHSRKSQFVTQEIYAGLIMYNMTIVVASCISLEKKKRKYEYNIKISVAINIVRKLLTGGVDPPAAEILLTRNISPIRPNRNCPRKKRAAKEPVNFMYRIA